MAVAPRSARCRDPEAPLVSYEQVPDEYTTLANLDLGEDNQANCAAVRKEESHGSLSHGSLSVVSQSDKPIPLAEAGSSSSGARAFLDNQRKRK